MFKKFLFSILVFSSISSNLHAQDSTNSTYTGGLTKFITWISNIDVLLSGIDNKENLEALNRNLGYTSLYIDNITDEKILLAKEIEDLKSDRKDETHIPSLNKRIDQIVSDINNLTDYFNKIKALLSQTNQPEISNIILAIERGFQTRKLYYLKDIRDAIYKENIPYDQISKEAESSRRIAEKALEQIKIAKGKILAVLTK